MQRVVHAHEFAPRPDHRRRRGILTRRLRQALPQCFACAFFASVAWAQSTWTDTSASPSPPGLNASSAYDSARDELVLFAANQTWVRTGNTWSQRSTGFGSGVNERLPMVYDAARQQVLMFYQTILYAWDGQRWVASTAAKRPPKRQYTSMAYDSDRQCVLLFGGFSFSSKRWMSDT